MGKQKEGFLKKAFEYDHIQEMMDKYLAKYLARFNRKKKLRDEDVWSVS